MLNSEQTPEGDDAMARNGEKRLDEVTLTVKRREDLRIHDVTPLALAKALFGGAAKWPETRRAPKAKTA